jgi:hypothetical protein
LPRDRLSCQVTCTSLRDAAQAILSRQGSTSPSQAHLSIDFEHPFFPNHRAQLRHVPSAQICFLHLSTRRNSTISSQNYTPAAFCKRLSQASSICTRFDANTRAPSHRFIPGALKFMAVSKLPRTELAVDGGKKRRGSGSGGRWHNCNRGTRVAALDREMAESLISRF